MDEVKLIDAEEVLNRIMNNEDYKELRSIQNTFLKDRGLKDQRDYLGYTATERHYTNGDLARHTMKVIEEMHDKDNLLKALEREAKEQSRRRVERIKNGEI